MVDAFILIIVIAIVAMIVKNRLDESNQPPAEWWIVKEKKYRHYTRINVGVELHEDD